jgi:hypothetical protein
MNVRQLEQAWKSRIEAAARDALTSYRPGDFDPGYDGRHDHVTDEVEKLLFDSLEWEHVLATDISDIAYEAATKAIAAQREAAWAADRAMVADMERDGLL